MFHWIIFLDLKSNIDYQKIFNQYLNDLCISISNIRLILGLDVVVAGDIIEYLTSYEDVILKNYLIWMYLIQKDISDLQITKKENSSCKGATLIIIAEYISKI